MGHLTRQLFRQIRNWDRPSQIALAVALAWIIIVMGIIGFGPQDIRQTAFIALIGLIVIMQGVVLWGNRGMVTPFTQAQRHFLNGEFDEACNLLEEQRAAGQADIKALTLLGNTYRQLGRLDQSENVLQEALQEGPEHYFPLYGFGRTLLAKGHYADAVTYIRRALDAGAPAPVQFDLAHALYRQGDRDTARTLLEAVRSEVEEPHRMLMIAYLRYRLGAAEPPSAILIEAGLSYWEASARRFSHTPYGEALDADVRQLSALIEEA